MSDANTHNRDYCAALVKAQDEDRWLAAQYAPPGDRRRLIALYAFHCELRRIPAVVSEPPLGEIRLQWWRDALQELREGKPVRAHPVVAELAIAGLASEEFRAYLERVISAFARPLYEAQFGNLADLTEWLVNAEGVIDALAVRLLGGNEALARCAARAGAAFALAREGRAWAPQAALEIPEHVMAIADDTAPQLKRAPGHLAPALLPFALTRSYAKHGAKPFPAEKRLRLFSAMAFRRF